MIQTISLSDFRDAFNRLRPDNFSYDGLTALYEYFEEVNPDYDLDVIELCCDFAEDTIENVLDSYSLQSLEELRDNTCVVWNDHERVLYQLY